MEQLEKLNSLKEYISIIVDMCINNYISYPTASKTFPTIESANKNLIPSFETYLSVKSNSNYDFTIKRYKSPAYLIEHKIEDSIIKKEIPKKYCYFKYAMFKDKVFGIEYVEFKK